MGTLRVLSAHPNIGKPNDLIPGFPGAQAYVDAGLAEWVPPVGEARVDVVETTADPVMVETTSRRPATRRTRTVRRSSAAPEA